MENKYKEGSFVYAPDDKMIKLKVRRYVDHVYYCTVCDIVPAEERVYFERELTDEKPLV
jgi:hypothetical protein